MYIKKKLSLQKWPWEHIQIYISKFYFATELFQELDQIGASREPLKNAHELLNLRAVKIGVMYRMYTFQCIGEGQTHMCSTKGKLDGWYKSVSHML